MKFRVGDKVKALSYTYDGCLQILAYVGKIGTVDEIDYTANFLKYRIKFADDIYWRFEEKDLELVSSIPDATQDIPRESPDVKYLLPFYEHWDGDHNECYVYDSLEAMNKGIQEEFSDNLGETLQVYKVVPLYKIRLNVGVTRIDEGETDE